jgi:hypothetical protein
VLPTGAIGQLAAGVNPLDVGLSASGGGGNFLTDLLGEVGQNISMNLSDFKEDPIGFAKDKGMELISRRIQDALSGEGQQPQQSPQLLASMPTLPSVAAGPTAKAPLSLSSLLATTGPKKPGSGTALGLNNLAFERAAGSLPERLA